MTIAMTLALEVHQEMATTRRVIACVPEERARWKPHTKSWAAGELALHLANLPTWTQRALNATELDLEPLSKLAPPVFQSMKATLETFDANVQAAHEALLSASYPQMLVAWTLKRGATTMFTLPRLAVVRSFVMHHMIHHRGQLTVYLRMLDVPVPSVYGPTADAGF
jgi:uncharacterized damage-inducible protein DinB